MARIRVSPGAVAVGDEKLSEGTSQPRTEELNEGRIPSIQSTSEQNRGAERPRGPWGDIVSRVYQLDVKATYARLVSELTLGDGATEYGSVLAAVDVSARNIFDAARLVRAAKLEDEHLSSKVEERLEVMRSTARKEIAEGRAGTKAPALQEVEDRIIANWPDEVRALRASKAEMHGALRAAEGLETAWRSRASDLRAMLERHR